MGLIRRWTLAIALVTGFVGFLTILINMHLPDPTMGLEKTVRAGFVSTALVLFALYGKVGEDGDAS